MGKGLFNKLQGGVWPWGLLSLLLCLPTPVLAQTTTASTSKNPSAVLRPYVPSAAPAAPVAVKHTATVPDLVISTPKPAVATSVVPPVASVVPPVASVVPPVASVVPPLPSIVPNLKALAQRPPVDEPAKPSLHAELQAELQEIASALHGVKYKLGANDPSRALDCSALILRIMAHVGKHDLPRTASQMAKVSEPVAKHELQVGDLLFFNTRGRAYTHVGLYVGQGRFVHASSTKGEVITSSLANSYFAKRFSGARRVLGAGLSSWR